MELSAFILMPFAKKFDPRYKAIKQALRKAGMRGERVDKQSFHRQGITEKVLQQILEADVVIAEMSTNNPNVLYEVGYAHAKNKLSILLTTDARHIPFDLRNKRHVEFLSLADLTKKLLRELHALKVETDLTFDKADPECVATVAVSISKTEIIGSSQATSIRARVTTGSEVHVKGISAEMIEVQRRLPTTRSWRRFKPMQPIKLIWTDTDKTITDFSSASTKYVNIFHVDHKENKLSIWRAPIPEALAEFLSKRATYRVTISVMGRRTSLDFKWSGDWQSMTVEVASRR